MYKMDDTKRVLADLAIAKDASLKIPVMVYETRDANEYDRLTEDKDYLKSRDSVKEILQERESDIECLENIPAVYLNGDPSLKECWDDVRERVIESRIEVVLISSDGTRLRRSIVNL